MAIQYLYLAFIMAFAHFTLALRSLLEWATLAFSLAVAVSASLWCNEASKSWMAHCILRSEDLLVVNMELMARWTSDWSLERCVIRLLLQLLWATAIGKVPMGLLSTEASISTALAWEQASNDRTGFSVSRAERHLPL